MPAALDKACKAGADVVGTAGGADRRRAGDSAPKAARLKPQLRRDERASSTHLGDDAGRVPELVELLRATYGDERDARRRRRRGVSRRARHRGPLRPHERDRPRRLGTALEVLHRLLTATSASQPKPLHPMQVMASLVFHYQRLLRLDDPAITTKEQAAEVLGMKSAAARGSRSKRPGKLGTDGLREALGLLAQAELDLRGQSGLDERTVIDVLVARLAALSRRHARGRPRLGAERVERAATTRWSCARGASCARCGGRPGSCG